MVDGNADDMRPHSRKTTRIRVDQYRRFRADGFLVVKAVFEAHEVGELLRHTEDLMYGRLQVEGVPPAPAGATAAELEKRLLRIHMLHRQLEIHERFLLHPRLLDILEALIGPDLLALQTMLFIKGPGGLGQGYHQDTYYIPTFPDSLCGAWVALDHADEENGCLRMVVGSNAEPIYPPESGYGYGHRELEDIAMVANVGGAFNDDADQQNGLLPVASEYVGREIAVPMAPGDAAFFGGHILHRSLMNRSASRTRRAFVSHYCNARSFTPWDGGNSCHILARGATTLPYAQPRFGTPCAANHPETSRADAGAEPQIMMAMPDGSVGADS